MTALRASWERCWTGLGAKSDGTALRDRLLDAWREPQRRYHTLQHLADCIALFEDYRHLADHPAEVEMALWFHDAVYDVTAGDNEAQSAQLAGSELAGAGVGETAIERIRRLIMATCHAALPEGRDAQLLVDIDLAILGAGRDRFIAYEQQVRDEYGWVPEALFRERRAAILREFLDRQPLYHTPALQQRLEEQARLNLEWSLEQLGHQSN